MLLVITTMAFSCHGAAVQHIDKNLVETLAQYLKHVQLGLVIVHKIMAHLF
ncbi:hypothetical protein CMUST_02975 [Corynebacterium mustelae]|uniref:Uncharacterized protein n=1 Tax=Corynebacterium mustelae TaxID=571915 RepID=A0A0G3GUV0_9CORY|nr:hypothetical protein CMUST_02975 [Corynebacterium mustelae]